MDGGEITPGVQTAEYAARRTKLADMLPDGSLALFPSAPLAYMSHDVPFPLHQDADFSYLCGLLEPLSLLACVKPASGGGPARWHLFLRPSNPKEEMWDGARAGVEGAQERFLSDGAVHALNDAPKVLRAEVHGGGFSALFHEARANPEIHAVLQPLLSGDDSNLGVAHLPARSSRRICHALRVRKSAAEASLMRRSGAIGARAMAATMGASVRATAGGLTEAALAAHFEFECRVAGAERLAYPCVVAGGVNAVTLHYMHNNALLRPESMLLMDAGSSTHGYCSDVTRTWPLSGTFSPSHRLLYEAVLSVNEQIIAACIPDGKTTLNSLHRLSVQATLERLIDLGILSSDDPKAVVKAQKYYPHAIGHWLGMDVHDTPHISSDTPLAPGMVITVEPGLYLPHDDDAVPPHFRGVGIRIEDDVLIHPLPAGAGENNGRAVATAEVLTASCPKQPDEIEALLAQGG